MPVPVKAHALKVCDIYTIIKHKRICFVPGDLGMWCALKG